MTKLPEPDSLISGGIHKLNDKHLFELFEQMFSEVGIANVLQKTSELICEILHAERTTIHIVIKETQELRSVALIGNVAQSIVIPINHESLAGFCAMEKRSFVIADAEASFEDVHKRLDTLLNLLNTPYTIEEAIHPSFTEGRCGKIIIDGVDCGIIGEIHPNVLSHNQIWVPIVVFEIELPSISSLCCKIKYSY